MATKTQKGILKKVNFFQTIVLTSEYLKEMIIQTDKTNKKFPLKGIEHLYKPMRKPYNSIYLCRYCGYIQENLMHTTKDPY